MNNTPNVINVAKAQKHRSTFPLSFEHVTTQDFGKTTILHSMEVMPGDEIDFNLQCRAQLAPMVVPTMGNVNLYVRAFFVPYRFVWSDWEEFFSQKSLNKNGSAMLDNVPSFTTLQLWNLFLNENPQWLVTTSGKPDYYVQPDGASSFTRYKLTYHGRLARQIFEGLGYNVNPCYSGSKNEVYSALPLLALAKIFRDYYVNPNYEYTAIDKILNREFTSTDITSPNYQYLSVDELRTLILFVAFGWYESDILTSAWANPEISGYSDIFKKQSVSGSDFGISYPSQDIDGPFNDSVFGAIPSGLSSNDSVFTQIGLNILKSVRNFVMRQNASGGRYVDQLLSRFGIRLSENEARRAQFLGSFETSALIGRVDATTAGQATFEDQNTLRNALGDFTGRGIIDSNGHFHFKNDKNDFGMVIFVSHLMPRTAYYQGVKPHVNHLNFNDFFNPDLEDVSTAPLPNNEVFSRYVSNIVRDADYDSGFLKGVFGFAPNYYEYKTQFDYLTGDFSVPSINSVLKAYQLMRQMRSPQDSISQYFEDDEGIKPILGEEIQKANQDNVAPYNRMFLTQTQDADHFVMHYFFDVRATRNCNSLGNSLLAELNEHGNDVGDLIKVRPNGKYF